MSIQLKNKYMSIRIDEETRDELRKIASREERSIVNLVQLILKQYIKEHKSQ